MEWETGRSKTKQADHSKPFERNPLCAKKTELCDHISPKCVEALSVLLLKRCSFNNSAFSEYIGEREEWHMLGSISNPPDASYCSRGQTI